MKKNFYIHLVCPYCHRGEALADGKAKVTLSLVCPKCGGYYTADLETMKTDKAKACRRTSKMKQEVLLTDHRGDCHHIGRSKAVFVQRCSGLFSFPDK